MFSHLRPNGMIQKQLVKRTLLRPLAGLSLLTGLLLAACGTPSPAVTTVLTEATSTPLAATDPTATPAPMPEGNIETASASGQSAYVRAGVLYIQDASGNTIPLDDCSAGNCFIYHLDWSPTGTHLLYYIGSYDGSVPHQIRVADTTGAAQTVAEQPAYVQPAGWSWDGAHIAYRTSTGRYAEVSDGPGMQIQELWTVVVADDGTLGTTELRGEVTFGEGCGGGGRSESANLYEREGGFAYGYLSGVMLWTPADILLYSDNCTTIGISRFDLASNTALEPIPGLRSLSLNAAGDAWVAINDQNQIVTGTPDSLDATVITSTSAPELVFYGKQTGTIYYTTLEIVDRIDLVEQASQWMDQSINVYPSFDVTQASVVALDPNTGAETVLYANDATAYAYAHVTEWADGGLTFSRVESNVELQTAVEHETLTADNWRDYLPTTDLLYIAPNSNEVTVQNTNVPQYTPGN